MMREHDDGTITSLSSDCSENRFSEPHDTSCSVNGRRSHDGSFVADVGVLHERICALHVDVFFADDSGELNSDGLPSFGVL